MLLLFVATAPVNGLKIRVAKGETECVREILRESGTKVSGSWFSSKASAENGKKHTKAIPIAPANGMHFTVA